MENLETLLYEERGAVAIVTLNRPEVHNAFNLAMQHELRQCVAVAAHERRRPRRGPHRCRREGVLHRHRPEGGDRRYLDDPADETWGAERSGRVDAVHVQRPGRNINPKQNDLWKPVVAAVNGMACGGAFYMLGEADIIIAAEHATFFDPHVTYGMVAGFETVHLLQKLPLGETLRLALLGATERMSAARAYQLGLVSEVVVAATSCSTVRSGSLRRSPRRRRSRFKERSARCGWPRRPCGAKRSRRCRRSSRWVRRTTTSRRVTRRSSPSESRRESADTFVEVVTRVETVSPRAVSTSFPFRDIRSACGELRDALVQQGRRHRMAVARSP